MKTSLKALYLVLLFLIVSLSVFSPLPAKTATNFRSLYLGSRGHDVFLLQQKLQQKGYFPINIKPTGYFGLTTRKSVINFQKASHLPLVGIFGPLTNAVLLKLMAQSTISNTPLSVVSTSQPVTIPVPSVVIAAKTKTALPLYIYPSPDEKNWQIALDAAGNVDFIIANVYNGPGMEKKTNWTNMINKAAAAGVKVYGYVSTDYTRVNGETADKDVSLWFQFYPQISGIFFDEVSSGVDKLPYYKARYEYVKNINSNLKVVINPGTNTDEGYMKISDVNIIFESGYASWLAKKMPAWVANYPKERFYAIVYGVPSESEMKEVVKIAKQRNFGKMFITSADGPSDPLPLYFQAELAEIAK